MVALAFNLALWEVEAGGLQDFGFEGSPDYAYNDIQSLKSHLNICLYLFSPPGIMEFPSNYESFFYNGCGRSCGGD